MNYKEAFNRIFDRMLALDEARVYSQAWGES